MIEVDVKSVFKGSTYPGAQGIDEVRTVVSDMPSEVRGIARPLLFKYVSDLASERRGRAYPPELPNQKYIRTFDMQQGYIMQSGGADVALYVQTVDRRRYVVDREYQADIHKGRHETMQDDIEKTLDDFASELQAAILKQYA